MKSEKWISSLLLGLPEFREWVNKPLEKQQEITREFIYVYLFILFPRGN